MPVELRTAGIELAPQRLGTAARGLDLLLRGSELRLECLERCRSGPMRLRWQATAVKAPGRSSIT